MRAHTVKIDPVTLTVLWNTFVSIAEEMGSTLRRTAYSEAVREAEDFSTALFDRDARLVAQGNFTPGHLGSLPYVVKHVLEFFPPDELRPGDAVVLNDSFLGTGHYPDILMVTPVFNNGSLVGYVTNCTHHVDVGGAAPGSQVVTGVTEAFQEGLRILPVRLVRAGEFDKDMLRLILGNVRVPEKVEGDLRAQLNANYVGAERMVELFATYGRQEVEAAIENIIDRSEGQMRKLIADIPDGSYSFEDFMDDAGPGTDPIRVHVAVMVEGQEVTVDFSGSSEQVAAGLNSYINYTRAYAIFAIKVLTDPLLPHNEGSTRPIKVVSRPGTFFNPTFPAPSGGRATVQIRIFEAINGALSNAVPHRTMAAFSHWANPNIGGIDDRTGGQFVAYDLIMGGNGAWATKDGAEALSPVFNAANIPVEVHETNNPILVRRLELIQDSGGAGRFRGGCGIRKDLELLTSRAVITLLGDRHRFPPYGIFGGRPGELAQTVLNPDSDAVILESKQRQELEKGDVISLRLAGGGGYGNPAERDPPAVLEDVLDEFVSQEEAQRLYGVVLDLYRRTVGEQATADARTRLSRGGERSKQ